MTFSVKTATMIVTAATLVAATLASVATAEARPRPAQIKTKKFQANKTFGLGIMLGAPTGLSGKYFIGPSTAIDFGVGAIAFYRGRNGVHVHADYLVHPLSFASTPEFELPLYVGIGARLYDFDDKPGSETTAEHGLALGVRAPIGLALDFNNVPLDAFFELALVADIFVGYDEAVGIDLNGAIGVRYYFN